MRQSGKRRNMVRVHTRLSNLHNCLHDTSGLHQQTQINFTRKTRWSIKDKKTQLHTAFAQKGDVLHTLHTHIASNGESQKHCAFLRGLCSFVSTSFMFDLSPCDVLLSNFPFFFHYKKASLFASFLPAGITLLHPYEAISSDHIPYLHRRMDCHW